MGTRYDPESRLADLFALCSAETADELRRELVLGAPAATETEHSMALAHFTRVHERDPVGAAETAMLLTTDPRWHVVSHRLIKAIAATGLVAPGELDLLAHAFVMAGPHVWWGCPSEWFVGPSIVIDLGAEAHDSVEVAEDGSDDRPVVVAREVPAGARRWAAERVVRQDPSGWLRVLRRAREIGGVDGAALVRGILDSVDVLAEGAARALRTEALRWGRADVRLAALELLAEDDADLARWLAARDPNGNVRRWASRTAPRPVAAVREEPQAALF